jgi:hypothetical protein
MKRQRFRSSTTNDCQLSCRILSAQAYYLGRSEYPFGSIDRQGAKQELPIVPGEAVSNNLPLP